MATFSTISHSDPGGYDPNSGGWEPERKILIRPPDTQMDQTDHIIKKSHATNKKPRELTQSEKNRMIFASKLEINYLDKGLDIYVTCEGDKKQILNLKYILMSRIMAYKIINGDLPSAAKEVGFTKLIMQDGYDSSWSSTLK